MPKSRKRKRADGSTTAAQSKGCPERLIKYQWKPGQSGNPSGPKRTKHLTRMLEELLASVDPKDKQKRTFAQIFIREFVDRAIDKSDLLMLAILDRLDGKLRPDTVEEGLSDQPPVFVLCDMPAPKLPAPPLLPKAIDVKPSSPAK